MFITTLKRFQKLFTFFSSRQHSETVAALKQPLLRQEIAVRYLTGTGLEIGALHNPLPVPPHVTVRYVDRLPLEELRKHYPELEKASMVSPEIIDNGEILASLPDSSVDFVIANHMIEHSQDPITALKNWLRVIKPGGIVYLAIPDKRQTFDKDRPVTTIDHLMQDYADSGQKSRNAHFEKWVRLVYKTPAKGVASRVRELMEMDYSIHYHVWTPKDFFELLTHCQKKLHFPFQIELFQANNDEVVAILRRISRLNNLSHRTLGAKSAALTEKIQQNTIISILRSSPNTKLIQCMDF